MGGEGRGGGWEGRVGGWEGSVWEWEELEGISKGKGGYYRHWDFNIVHSFYLVRASAITNIVRVPHLHGQQFKYFSQPDLPDFNWRSVFLWALSFSHNFH